MHADVKRLRAVLAEIPGAWVRRYSNGVIWAGAFGEFSNSSTEDGMHQVCAALKQAGIAHECNGKPGTSGAYIVDVYLD